MPELDKSQVIAIRALKDGLANERQQKIALAAIVNDICETHSLVYEPNSFDGTAFRAGRAYVGQIILGQLKDETIKYITDIERVT